MCIHPKLISHQFLLLYDPTCLALLEVHPALIKENSNVFILKKKKVSIHSEQGDVVQQRRPGASLRLIRCVEPERILYFVLGISREFLLQ